MAHSRPNAVSDVARLISMRSTPSTANSPSSITTKSPIFFYLQTDKGQIPRRTSVHWPLMEANNPSICPNEDIESIIDSLKSNAPTMNRLRKMQTDLIDAMDKNRRKLHLMAGSRYKDLEDILKVTGPFRRSIEERCTGLLRISNLVEEKKPAFCASSLDIALASSHNLNTTKAYLEMHIKTILSITQELKAAVTFGRFLHVSMLCLKAKHIFLTAERFFKSANNSEESLWPPLKSFYSAFDQLQASQMCSTERCKSIASSCFLILHTSVDHNPHPPKKHNFLQLLNFTKKFYYDFSVTSHFDLIENSKSVDKYLRMGGLDRGQTLTSLYEKFEYSTHNPHLLAKTTSDSHVINLFASILCCLAICEDRDFCDDNYCHIFDLFLDLRYDCLKGIREEMVNSQSEEYTFFLFGEWIRHVQMTLYVAVKCFFPSALVRNDGNGCTLIENLLYSLKKNYRKDNTFLESVAVSRPLLNFHSVKESVLRWVNRTVELLKCEICPGDMATGPVSFLIQISSGSKLEQLKSLTSNQIVNPILETDLFVNLLKSAYNLDNSIIYACDPTHGPPFGDWEDLVSTLIFDYCLPDLWEIYFQPSFLTHAKHLIHSKFDRPPLLDLLNNFVTNENFLDYNQEKSIISELSTWETTSNEPKGESYENGSLCVGSYLKYLLRSFDDELIDIISEFKCLFTTTATSPRSNTEPLSLAIQKNCLSYVKRLANQLHKLLNGAPQIDKVMTLGNFAHTLCIHSVYLNKTLWGKCGLEGYFPPLPPCDEEQVRRELEKVYVRTYTAWVLEKGVLLTKGLEMVLEAVVYGQGDDMPFVPLQTSFGVFDWLFSIVNCIRNSEKSGGALKSVVLDHLVGHLSYLSSKIIKEFVLKKIDVLSGNLVQLWFDVKVVHCILSRRPSQCVSGVKIARNDLATEKHKIIFDTIEKRLPAGWMSDGRRSEIEANVASFVQKSDLLFCVLSHWT